MYAHDKRRSRGSMVPNFFFMLQLTIIGLLAYMFVEIASILNVSSIIMYGMIILLITTVFLCLEKRHNVIKRQRFC
ncbi:hypothetical protein JHD47_00035 [Sulfurimonas sp. SAG-AH-194-L11]|nr:hypothetical protein [Sulfurimonas sp. SAG-AH-194-L11]MDF1876201.1 hypothetical protein [Sulfurimonas sp. SAG-AH-194-L11]